MFKHVKYKGVWYVMYVEQYEDFHHIPRDSTNPTVDPYKFSVAMITRRRKRFYITLLTGASFDFDVGIMREWIALTEAISEGVRLFQADIDRKKEVAVFKKKNERPAWKKILKRN